MAAVERRVAAGLRESFRRRDVVHAVVAYDQRGHHAAPIFHRESRTIFRSFLRSYGLRLPDS